MLSGIGPKLHLQETNIPCIQDLNVGHNLHDHPTYYMIYFSTNVSVITEPLLESIKDYFSGFGKLTISAISAIGFVQFRVTPSKTPSIEYLFTFATPGPQLQTFLVNITGVKEEYYNALASAENGKRLWTIMPILQHPKSVGRVQLRTKKSTDFPKIDLNYFSDRRNEDIKEMVRAIKDIFQLSKTGPFRSINSQYVGKPIPGCSTHQHLSDEYWECVLRHLSTTLYHPTGTAAMGNIQSGRSVVDCNFRVHGISNLRVADASVIPTTMSGHPQALCYVIGEMAAEYIKNGR